MVGPKPKPVRPQSAKFEKPSEGKLVKKNKKPVVKPVDTKKVKKTKEPAVVPKPLKADKTSKSKDSKATEISKKQIEEGIKAFKKLLELKNTEKSGNDLFAEDGQKINLQISGIKVPREVERQVIKIRLPQDPHPINKDVCVFVKDLEKGLKVDHEDTVRHFTEMLQDKGITTVTQVISLRELKVEYKQFEAKIKLSNKFDVFLADDRIIRLLPQFLGKHFYKRKKMPVPINLLASDLRTEFDKCVMTTQLSLTNTGSCSSVMVGHTNTDTDHLVDNITTVTQTLANKYPGGWTNIRSIWLNTGSTSLPLYASLTPTSEVGYVSGRKTKSRGLVTDELSTVPGATVTVTPSGHVRVKRTADPDWDNDDDETKMKMSKDDQKVEEEEEDDHKENEDKEDSSKEKKTKDSKKKKTEDSDESEDEMEDQELEYMKKCAEEEEEMERKLEENDEKINKKLQEDPKEDDNSEEDVDDDEEAENLLSDNDDTDEDDDNIMMRKTIKDINEEIAADPPLKEKNKKAEKAKNKKAVKKAAKESKKSAPAKPLSSKEKKQQKFIEKKKKEKTKSKK